MGLREVVNLPSTLISTLNLQPDQQQQSNLMSRKKRRKLGRRSTQPVEILSPAPVAPLNPSRRVRGTVLLIVAAGVALGWFCLQRSERVGPDGVARETAAHNGRDQVDHAEVVPAAISPAMLEGVGTLTTPQLAKQVSAQRTHLDPRGDGWDTEAFAESAAAQLQQVSNALATAGSISQQDLKPILAVDFACGPLKPLQLEDVFSDGALVVRRSAEPKTPEPARPYGSSVGLAEALQSLLEGTKPSPENHVHFKLVQVQPSGAAVTTTAYYQASYRTSAGLVQQRATWHCRWKAESEDSAPRLTEIVARDYEEVVTIGDNGPLFADCTEAVLGGNPSFGKHVVHGLNHWLSRIERSHGMYIFASYGMALGDVNGDGLEDVYLCQPGGVPNRLYIQNPDGTATDRSHEAGVDWLDHTSSALLVDLDNDGDQDLVAAVNPTVLIMENDSTGKFKKRAQLHSADGDLYSLSAVDYDDDGDLDVYSCVEFSAYGVGKDQARVAFEYHDANDGGANALFRNDINESQDSRSNEDGWKFTEVTVETGLDTNNRRHSLAAAWEDYDNDGDQDLYVANDYGQNCLYRNDSADPIEPATSTPSEEGSAEGGDATVRRGGRRFVDVAKEAGVVDFGSGMSVSWMDYNRDGQMDLYVANMFSSAGNRISRQPGFRPNADATERNILTRFAKGNSLFENVGDGRFREVGNQANVEVARWAWGSLFADLNNDGWEDLMVANGYITGYDTGDL